MKIEITEETRFYEDHSTSKESRYQLLSTEHPTYTYFVILKNESGAK